MTPTLSIIIISYNTRELLSQTLESVFAALSGSLVDRTEIWVIDNNSSDDSVAAVRELTAPCPLHIIENSENIGFGRANNQALEKAQGDYLLLLNSDTIIKPTALNNLLQTFTDHPIREATAELSSHHGEVDRLGIVAATLLNPDGSIQPQGGSYPTLLSLACHMLMLDDIPVLGKWFPSTQHTGYRASDVRTHLVTMDWVGGTAMMLKREMLTEIGTLDPNIFMYGEDMELCMRARHHLWDVAITPLAEVVHLGNASSSSGNAIKGEFYGYLYVWSKHKPQWQLGLVKTLLKVGALLRVIIFGTISRQPSKRSVYSQLFQQL